MYGIDDPSQFDGWPPYYFVTESPERKSVIQKYYMALLTMVDAYVGKVLDYMDHYDLWQGHDAYRQYGSWVPAWRA